MARLTKKQKLQRDVLRKLIPGASFSDFDEIFTAMRSKHMASLDFAAAAYLATLAHIRHQHTQYDALRDEGYDHDSARHFIVEEVNEVLRDWGSTTQISTDEEDAQPAL